MSARRGSSRRTRQLEAIYEVLARASDHPSAESVFRRVRGSLPRVSRGTVYRNLAKLLDEGRIRLVPSPDRSARYDARLDDHDHFVCIRCGAVIDVPARSAPRSAVRIDGHLALEVDQTYRGRCRSCEQGAAAERAPRRGTPPTVGARRERTEARS